MLDLGREQADATALLEVNREAETVDWAPSAAEKQQTGHLLNKVFKLSALIVSIDNCAIKFGNIVQEYRADVTPLDFEYNEFKGKYRFWAQGTLSML